MQVAVEYIGKKPKKEDNVAGTGVVWHGAGDVQMVDRAAAAKLIYYTDVWRLAPQEAAVAVVPKKPAPVNVVPDPNAPLPKTEPVNPAPVNPEPPANQQHKEPTPEEQAALAMSFFNPEGATKAELAVYAKREFNVDLPDTMKKDEMQAKVKELIGGRRYDETAVLDRK